MYNILNLVFDDWENNIPKENLHLLNIRKNHYFKLPVFLIDQKKIKINVCTISDINLNQDFYYFIRNFAYDNFFNEENWLIPNHVENLIKTKNLKVIFFNEHESYNNLKESIKELSIIINKKQLNEEQFYVINNNINIYTNGEFDVQAADLIYYRQPIKIQIQNCVDPYTGITSTTEVECEFKDDIIELIIDEAVSILAGDIESGNQFTRGTQTAERNN
jgi:hypothetical protein